MKKAAECLIMVVDDDEQSRSFMMSILDRLGFQGLVADSGASALDLLISKKPDLMLVDGMMPNMDGFELIQKIRQISGFENTPIVMTTALDDAKHIKEAISTGANAYVVKPINVHRLKEKINELLEYES